MPRLRFLRIFLILLFFAFCVLRFAMHPSYAEDKIIAIVNNDVITQRDLDEFVNFMRVQLSREYKGEELAEKINSMKQGLLDRLIEDRLILQEAKKNSIKVEEGRVKAKISQIKKHYPTDTDFQNDLKSQGLVQADIENRFREQLQMYVIIEQKVRSKIVVRPEEVTKFFNEAKNDFFLSEVREFDAFTLDNVDLAKSFSYYLKSGEKLENLATRYPVIVNKLKGAKGGELRKDIEEVVFRLNPGEASDPVKIDDKYYVFKLGSVIPPRLQGLLEVQDKIHAFLFEKKMQEGLAKWLDELKKQSYFKILQN